MSEFDPNWFDIVSIFSREGKPGQISIHAFKQPYTCQQFFIPAEMLNSPTFWEDLHTKAIERWERGPKPGSDALCPNCKTSRSNWQRWYEGRAFCGFCGHDILDQNKAVPQKIKVTRGNYSLDNE